MKKMNLFFSLFHYLSIFIIVPAVVFSDPANEVKKVFEYKYSFKPPNIVSPDGRIPFWERVGNILAGADNIRVAQSLRSQRGSIWGKNKTNFDWWEVEIVFRISGRGRVGADGLAFWYIDEKTRDGSVFGGPDKWNGLGIFFDTFDNDNKHNNPYIMAMTNDGTIEYDHLSDGFSQKAAGCVKDFRNKPFPLRAKIRYHNKALTLYFNNGMSKGTSDREFELCFKCDDLSLPQNGFFGISAATGGLADDHDIQYFLTSRIDESFHFTPDADQPNEEMMKYDKEYLEYEQKLQEEKHKYKAEHPEAYISPEEDPFSEDFIYDDMYNKILRNVYQEQSQSLYWTSMVSSQLDDVLGKHESIVKSVEIFKGYQAGGHVTSNSTVRSDGFQRYEVENIIATSSDLLKIIDSIKADLQLLEGKIAKPPPGQIPGIHSDEPSVAVHEATRDFKQLQSQMRDLTPKILARSSNCPSGICVSTKVYVSFSVITTGIVVAFMLYKDRPEPPVKKFY